MATQGLSRRTLLRMLGYGPVLSGIGWPFQVSAETGEGDAPCPFILILTDLPANMPAEILRAFLAPFAERFLRLGIAVPSPANAEVSPELMALIAQAQMHAPGLVEILPDLPAPEVGETLAYAKARGLSAQLDGFQNLFPEAPALPVSLSVRPGAPEAADWSRGVRALGVRTVFARRPQTSPSSIAAVYDPIWQVQGGPVWSWQDGVARWSAELVDGLARDSATSVHLSLRGLQNQTPQIAAVKAQALAGILAGYKDAGALVSLLPRELSFRSLAQDYGQSMLLLVEEARTEAEADALTDLRAQLEAIGVVFETCPLEGDKTTAFACMSAGIDQPGYASCQVILDKARLSAVSLAVVRPDSMPGIGGPDATGVISVPFTADISESALGAALFDEVGSARASLRDGAIVLRQSALITPSARALLADAISRLIATVPVRFLSGADFAMMLFPDFLLLDRLHRAEAAKDLPELLPAPLETLSELSLAQDASIAFAYFTNLADPQTGLSVATDFRSEGFTSRYETVTQWDLASNLFAILSAMELGLVDEQEGEAWLAKIIASIPTREIQGLTLPIAEFDYRLRDTRNREYNASDTGRLLIALRAVAEHTSLKQDVEMMVAAWDLAETIRDGLPMSIYRGRFDDMSGSQYTHYIRRGYALWGVEMPPVFVTNPSDEDFTRQMRVMEKAARSGLLAPEPYALEEVELGATGPAKILTDVLIAAQYDSYRNSGELIAMTETPLDQAPWFTYQGLDLKQPGQVWRVRSNPPNARYETAKAQAALRVFSSKAAYLMAATRPSAFSDRLVEAVRSETAASDDGFRVGRYAQSGRAMQSYSDINTNGIILEALAYLARGSKPMIMS